MTAALDAGSHQPFFASGAGAVTLVLIGALAAGAVSWYLSYRKDVRDQNKLLWTLRNAIVPDGRAGLVERVERLESNLNECSRELEAHTALSETQRRELMQSITDLRTFCERELRNRVA